MKNLSIIIMPIMSLFLIFSCKPSKETDLKANLKTEISNCPDDGVCTFEVLKNKSLEIKEDGIGALYPLLYQGDSNVLKFEYKRNEKPNIQDGNYSELIYIEVPLNIENIELKDNNLTKYKVLFARLCFCRGQTGYYKITEGNLSLNKINNDAYNLQLNFKTEVVPQIITSINETFNLKKKRLN